MKKKLINIFLLLFFSVQILPMQPAGNLLFGKQLTEDVPNATDDIAKDGCKAEGKSEFAGVTFESMVPHFTDIVVLRKNVFFSLPHNHSADITNPPPNRAI